MDAPWNALLPYPIHRKSALKLDISAALAFLTMALVPFFM
jgi:hypothetical protein